MSIENLKTFGKSIRHSPPFSCSGVLSTSTGYLVLADREQLECHSIVGTFNVWMVARVWLSGHVGGCSCRLCSHLDLRGIFSLAG